MTNSVPGRDIGTQQSGSARYLQAIVDHFRDLGLDVTLIVVRPAVDFVWCRARSVGAKLTGPSFRQLGGVVIVVSPLSLARALAWTLYTRLPQRFQPGVDALRLALRRSRGFSHCLGRVPSAADRRFIESMVHGIEPDFIVYDGLFNSCGRLTPAQHWLITHDVKHQRAASFRAQEVRVVPDSFSEEAERRVLADIGNIIAIQWDDAAEFWRLCPESRVVVVPAVMPFAPSAHARVPVPGRCLFVGSGSYHNYDGIAWFIKECWPQIRRAVPDASLDVVGSVCFRLSDPPPGVFLRGVVDDLTAVYRAAAVTIVPLRIGSGLKVKLAEALANDQAVVTTSIGAQGLANIENRAFVIADSSASFAVEITALLASPERQNVLRTHAASCARLFRPPAAFAELDGAMFADGTPAS